MLGLVTNHREHQLGRNGIGVAVDAGECFVDGNRAEGGGADIQQSAPQRSQVRSDTEVHDKIGTGVERRGDLGALLVQAGFVSRAPQVGIDLGAEASAHDLRVEPRVGRVGRQNSPPGREKGTDLVDRNMLLGRHRLHLGGDSAIPRAK